MSGAGSRALFARVRAEMPLKAFGTTAFITLFFVAYFAALNHPQFPVRIMRPGMVDALVPYQMWTIGIYFTLWVYVSIPPALMRNRPELCHYGWVSAALALSGLAVFTFWPTKVLHEGADFLKRVDPGGNAFPSMHAAYAVLTAVVLDRILRSLVASLGWRIFNAAWCAAILYSTLSTKQHVFSDIAVGSAMGLIAAQFFNSSRLNVPD